METVKVAFGEEKAKYAEEYDPKGQDDLKLPDGSDVWSSYVFGTPEEADAFILGITESAGWLEAYTPG